MSQAAQKGSALGTFLRARLRPPDVGLPSVGRRRTPGLRREWDVLAWNTACVRVFGDYASRQGKERNTIWRMFFDPSWRELVVDWEREARKAVAIFRFNTRHYLGTLWFDQFVSQLAAGSPNFAA